MLRSLGIAGALARAGIAGVVARAEIAGALARAGIDTSLSFSLSLAPSLARFSARLEGVVAARRRLERGGGRAVGLEAARDDDLVGVPHDVAQEVTLFQALRAHFLVEGLDALLCKLCLLYTSPSPRDS